MPQHHVEAQTSPSPYHATIDTDKVRAGDTITITVSGATEKDKIKGFFLEVLDKNGKPFGSFDVASDDKYVQTRNCAGGSKVWLYNIFY